MSVLVPHSVVGAFSRLCHALPPRLPHTPVSHIIQTESEKWEGRRGSISVPIPITTPDVRRTKATINKVGAMAFARVRRQTKNVHHPGSKSGVLLCVPSPAVLFLALHPCKPHPCFWRRNHQVSGKWLFWKRNQLQKFLTACQALAPIALTVCLVNILGR